MPVVLMTVDLRKSTASLAIAAVLVAGLAVFLAFVFRGNLVPIVSDEIGYLAIAKYMVTGEKITLAVMPAYRFGQALLYAPFFAAGLQDETVYQIGVVINCVQAALIPGLLLLLAGRFEVLRTWPVVAASVLVAVFPAYTYQLTVLWPETSLRFAWVLFVYLAASGWRLKSGGYWLASVVVAAWMAALHGRGLLVLPALVCFLAAAWWTGRVRTTVAVACAGVLLASVIAISEIQKDISIALWGAYGGEAKFIRANLLREGGISNILTTLSGHLWSQVASSFGLVVVGFLGAIWWARGSMDRAAVLGLVVLACGASAMSSAMHLAMMTRVDYFLYSRYNDAYAVIFVWIGLCAVLSFDGPRRWAGAAIVFSLAVLGGIAAYGATGLSGMVTPNIPALIWIDTIMPIQSASHVQIIAIGSLLAGLVGLAASLFTGRLALLVLVPLLAILGLHTKTTTWAAHNSRAHVVNLHRPYYGGIEDTLYWDRSVRTNLNLMFDEYIALEYAMPRSDLGSEDIPEGRSAVVSLDFDKPGYACVAELNYDVKIVSRRPGSATCPN